MKKFDWKKIGRIITPQNFFWMKSHAMCPTPEIIDKNSIRIFFSGRNKKNQSTIGHADLKFIKFPNKFKVKYYKNPDLETGDLGTFDDNGVTPTCVINYKNKKYLYYVGWNKGSTVRMHLFGGLAIKDKNSNKFVRYSRAPIIERNKINPILNTAPYVMKLKNSWVMYYVSGIKWITKNLPKYNIQIAFSKDLKIWKRSGKIAIDFKNKNEFALARPWVIKKDNYYYMWFCSKGNWIKKSNYKLCFAYSTDGIKWKRIENSSVIEKSKNGWDSEMVEYASVIEFKNKFLMFYNGNDFGKTGLGLAISD
jgi:predicted GH43/DUF377 family glycosyl hydrolase